MLLVSQLNRLVLLNTSYKNYLPGGEKGYFRAIIGKKNRITN